MNEKKSKTFTARVISVIFVGLIIGLLIYLLYKKVIGDRTYQVLLCLVIFLYWVVQDILIPIVTKDFEGRTPEMMNGYRKYAALDLVGFAGLAWFGISFRGENSSFYGALVYFFAYMTKKRFWEEFQGITHDEDDEEEAEEEEDTDYEAEDTLTADDAEAVEESDVEEAAEDDTETASDGTAETDIETT